MSRPTLGPAVGEVARLLGKPFMPWQQLVADVLLEIDPGTGRLAYQEFGLTVPRQSGKSTFLLAKAVHRASATQFFGPRQRIVYTAQTRSKAREKWEEDFLGQLKVARAFRGRFRQSMASGNEHVRFANGSKFGIDANTEKAGHGGTIDEADIDEAFAQADNRLEQAFRPAMITRPNKQLGWISTAGWDDGSPYLLPKVAKGREAAESGANTGLAYFEWSAPPDADPDDRNVWRACMPALGLVRPDGSGITEDAIAAELAQMDLPDFRRAYLNQWVPKPVTGGSAIDPALWATLADPVSQIVGGFAFAVDVSPDRGWSSVGVAGLRADGLEHVEVVAHLPGTDWVVPFVAEKVRANRPCVVMLDKASAAAALLPEFEAERVKVTATTLPQMGQACGGFYDSVVQGRLRHLDYKDLNEAVAQTRKRELGEGAFGWARKGQSDITPLVAATLARYGHAVHGMNAGPPNVW